MDEVGVALISIALVLCAVFVPTAFLQGIVGQFYRQFALTIAVATLLSAFNSLTLSPALCAVLLKHGPRSIGPMRYVLRAIDGARDGYVAVVRRLVRVSIVGVVVVVGSGVADGEVVGVAVRVCSW